MWTGSPIPAACSGGLRRERTPTAAKRPVFATVDRPPRATELAACDGKIPSNVLGREACLRGARDQAFPARDRTQERHAESDGAVGGAATAAGAPLRRRGCRSRCLLLDRDTTLFATAVAAIDSMVLEPTRTTYRSPWQNGLAQRWRGTRRPARPRHRSRQRTSSARTRRIPADYTMRRRISGGTRHLPGLRSNALRWLLSRGRAFSRSLCACSSAAGGERANCRERPSSMVTSTARPLPVGV